MPRGRAVAFAFAAVGILAGGVGLLLWVKRPKPIWVLEWTEAQRRDVAVVWEAGGVLESEGAVNVLTPLIPWFRRGLVWMAPEGALVRRNEPVAKFDPTDIELSIESARWERGGYRAQQFDLKFAYRQRLADLQQQLDTSVQDQKASQAQYESTEFGVEMERGKALAKLRQSMAELDLARSRIVQEERKRDLEIRGLEDQINQVTERIRMMSNWLGLLEVRAPAEGLITYPNIRIAGQERKASVGDNLGYGQVFISIPNLFDMNVALEAGEDAVRRLAVGQKAEVSLEADPGKVYPGVVRRLNPVARVKTQNRFVKIFPVAVKILREAPEALKPGMRARVRVTVSDLKNVLTVPLAFLHGPDSAPMAWIVTNGQIREWPLELADRTERLAVLSQAAPGRFVKLADDQRRVLRLTNVFEPRVAWKRVAEKTGGGNR
ncbi:MAG: efflux RND transporter periplasmic adaptor subunit [Spirochaetes bacterium]|nr:efflux RND transporter periplasmic adaptor subunit [Spirochaetota bacterium]